MPPQPGRRFVITGANSGVGFQAARILGSRGAELVLACRNLKKGEAAARQVPGYDAGRVVVRRLDVADLRSVREFADAFLTEYDGLDVLINNAGVLGAPYRLTADGVETHFATNHLGHYALTNLLLPAMRDRVVVTSSREHRSGGGLDPDDVNWERRRYRAFTAYAQSKLANLLFAYELQRRLERSGARAISVACHPGYSATNLQAVGPRLEGSRFWQRIMDIGNRWFAQSAAMGALPTLYAATHPDVRGGDYIGPDGFMENTGYPKRTTSNARSHNLEDARRLWEVSETLTHVRYTALSST